MKVFIIDVRKCSGCYSCQLVCKDEHCGNDWTPYARPQLDTGQFWGKLNEYVRGSLPQVKISYVFVPCQHCVDAPCIAVCPVKDALYSRDDGLVIIDPKRCTGCKNCIDACPYQAIYFNSALNIAQKCTGCAHLLDRGWKEPRCVEACPTRALVFGDLDDPGSEVARLVASGKTEVLRPEYEMADKVTYIGLPKRFVAGTVVFGDTDGCGEGAEITLRATGGLLPAGAAQSADGLQSVDGASGGTATRIVLADNYGDFEFEGLPSDETFTLKVEAAGYESRELFATTAADVYLGEIVLAPLDAAAGTGPGCARGAPRAASGRQGGTDTGGR
jgi:tetrathionate reductase subunit B